MVGSCTLHIVDEKPRFTTTPGLLWVIVDRVGITCTDFSQRLCWFGVLIVLWGYIDKTEIARTLPRCVDLRLEELNVFSGPVRELRGVKKQRQH